MSAPPHRRMLPDAPSRRGWCPSLARPMPTGDGLLARVHPPLGMLSLEQARVVARGARHFGNGHLDLTARANLQIRGVSEASSAPLAGLLTEAGLGDRRADGGPQRLTLTQPRAGQDPTEVIDVPALARAIEAAALDIPGLPAKTLVVVEGRPDVTAPEADCLVTARDAGFVDVAIAAADRMHTVTDCTATEAPAVVSALLAAFARTGRRRMRDLSEAERAALLDSVAAAVGHQDRQTGPATRSALPLCAGGGTRDVSFAPATGRDESGSVQMLTVDAPFGRCTAAALDRVVSAAEAIGADAIRLSPTRGFVLLASAGVPAVAALADLATDFIVAPDDPRRSVDACTGAPGCASGSTATLLDAERLAQDFRPLAAQGLAAHVSGCAKGCARPGPADLTLIGSQGRYGIVLGGAPGDEPAIHLPIEAVLDRLGRAKTGGLAAAFAPNMAWPDDGGDGRPA
ncbi:precorrin-3B synthase [Methylobacterium sp. E-005]|uniref:precorrin-3B synthase n=1 Tax=Methylobacterium sp. E-005 TaxID=2836549 RepID=UPI001FB9150B|nr:precorrin-3B synthase [Methylobacterium sp. E-005]MCJ2090503.1 precorrin-3B synthase [Methylobacterium sp. E-005]